MATFDMIESVQMLFWMFFIVIFFFFKLLLCVARDVFWFCETKQVIHGLDFILPVVN